MLYVSIGNKKGDFVLKYETSVSILQSVGKLVWLAFEAMPYLSVLIFILSVVRAIFLFSPYLQSYQKDSYFSLKSVKDCFFAIIIAVVLLVIFAISVKFGLVGYLHEKFNA